VITNADFRFIAAETDSRNAASRRHRAGTGAPRFRPAVAAAAALASRARPAGAGAVLAADNIFRKPEEFLATCREAATIAAAGASSRLA